MEAYYLDPKKNPAPFELEIYLLVKKWGLLPTMGGILDQPACLVRDFRAIEDGMELAELQKPPDHLVKGVAMSASG